MIKAEHAQRIMQRFEDDYDNFLDKLKAKRNAKKQRAAQAKTAADRATVTVAQAEARKPGHLREKAQNLLDKVGGIEGASSTAQNVMKYFKTESGPSDYAFSVGGGGDSKPDKGTDPMKIFGMSAIAVIGGGTLITLAVIYGIYRMVKKPAPSVQASELPQTIATQRSTPIA